MHIQAIGEIGRSEIFRRAIVGIAAVFTVLWASTAPAGEVGEISRDIQAKLKTYETKYYQLYTDLPEETVREAIMRLTTAAEEYAARTKGFAGAIRAKAPVYLFGSEADYKSVVSAKYASSGGLCQVRGQTAVLYVRADKAMGANVWKTMRHEGFHQFVRLVIGGHIPVWVNEGLAVYFENSVWTGDALICDLIPPEKLRSLKAIIESGKLMPFSQMVEMTNEKWNSSLKSENYLQAWSMVYFLAHGENGRYQQAFSAFINDVAGGGQPAGAFANRIGRDFEAFQKKYCEYWKAMPDNPSVDLYRQATVQILTGFLGRASALKMKFGTADEFFQAASDGKLAIDAANQALWLPGDLLDQAVKAVKQAGQAGGQWSLEGDAAASPRLVLRAPDGTVVTGEFKAAPAGPPKVWSTVKKTAPPATQKAANPAAGPKDGANQASPSSKPPGGSAR